jgi:release factor glutamine methyltransferase
MDTTRVWVLAHPQSPLTREQASRYGELIERRAAGEPVAYLRGWIEWHGLTFDVTPSVLVPRPETELLLEHAVDLARLHAWRALADIGTGSGVLAIGLALALPDARVEAVDVSASALSVASHNAERHGVSDRVTFLLGNLVAPLTAAPDLIVANLPYLSDEMMHTISADVGYEPVTALHAGPTGLELVQRLRDRLHVRGWRVPLLLEIDPRQATAAVALFSADARVDLFRDYAGHDRIVSVFPETT